MVGPLPAAQECSIQQTSTASQWHQPETLEPKHAMDNRYDIDNTLANSNGLTGFSRGQAATQTRNRYPD